MTPFMLPVTLATASVLALIYIVLVLRVVRGRFKARVSLGDGGNDELRALIRSHGNFAEYVPLLLIFMALLELAGTDKTVLAWAGGSLVVFRILHLIGLPRRAPNPYRFLGTLGTMILTAAAAVYGLVLVFGA